MNKLNDFELISAYIDNQLSKEQTTEVEARLQSDAEFAALLADFQQADLKYMQSLDIGLQGEVPESILQKLNAPKKKPLALHYGLAASLLAVALLFTTTFSFQSEDATKHWVHQALDSQPSNQWIQFEEGTGLWIALSFQHQDGRLCRDYIFQQGDNAQRLIACKGQQWGIEIQTETSPLSTTQGYRPANGEEQPEVEIFLDKHIQGAPFDAVQEQKAILQGWH